MSVKTFLIKWFLRHAKVKIADVVDVLNAIDANKDGEITAGELVEIVVGISKG